MVDIDFLIKVDVLKGMDVEQLAAVKKLCSEEEHDEGSRIFAEGSEARQMCFVIKGQVDLRYELPQRKTSVENTLSSILAYGSFGWSAFVVPNRYALSSYTAKKTTLVRVDRDDMLEMFQRKPHLGYLFMSNLSQIIGQRFYSLQNELARQEGLNAMAVW